MPEDRRGASANKAVSPTTDVTGGSIKTLAGLYTTWLNVGRSDQVVGLISSLAMADLLHSAGLMKDSMYSRIGTFADIAFTTGQVANIFAAGAKLATLVEATEKAAGAGIDDLEKLLKLTGAEAPAIAAALGA